MILLLICCKMNHVILHTILLATLAKKNDYKKFVCAKGIMFVAPELHEVV